MSRHPTITARNAATEDQALEELVFKEIASNVALAAELICILCIAIGTIATIASTARAIARRQMTNTHVRREIWTGLAVWIILALEFALGADIVRTAIAPTWSDIGQLAAIAAIRTALNFFLERDLEEFRPRRASVEASRPADTKVAQ